MRCNILTTVLKADQWPYLFNKKDNKREGVGVQEAAQVQWVQEALGGDTGGSAGRVEIGQRINVTIGGKLGSQAVASELPLPLLSSLPTSPFFSLLQASRPVKSPTFLVGHRTRPELRGSLSSFPPLALSASAGTSSHQVQAVCPCS